MAYQHIRDPPPGDETVRGGAVAPVARSVMPVGGSRVRLTGGLPAAWQRRKPARPDDGGRQAMRDAMAATKLYVTGERILLPLHRA